VRRPFRRGWRTRPYHGLQCQRCWLVPAVAGHYIENTGDTDLVFLEMFVAGHFQGLFDEQLAPSSSAEMVTSRLDIGEETIRDLACDQ
jgi:oxalate decarboxylase